MSAARILVVDDESEIRGLLKEILADFAFWSLMTNPKSGDS